LTVALALELKLVADLGLVGLPNAGKSTLLRALSNSRARVGAWAFTTLQPNIGTVVLDDHKGRPLREQRQAGDKPVTRFTIADIPGLVEDAHLNKGLGHEFLRHVERAKILAFVVDLSAGDGVAALKSLWREVGEYQQLKELEATEYSQRMVQWNPFAGLSAGVDPGRELFTREDVDQLPPVTLPPMVTKPWFVVTTKADLPETRENFERLREYVARVAEGVEDHPSGRPNSRTARACVVPVSAIRGEGIESVISVALNLMD
jgi:GTP-binding protein